MRQALVFCALIFVAILWVGCDVEDGPQEYNSDNSSWSLIGSEKMPGLYDACFINEELGYVCGKETFLAKTTDGADNWTIISLPDSVDEDLTIFVVNINESGEGFIAGRRALLLYTENGGETWTDLTDESLRERDFIQYERIDENTGYLLADNGGVWKTDNNGRDWDALGQISTVHSMKTIFFLDEDNGFAAGADSYRFKTTDGGESWLELARATNDSTLAILATWWFDENRGIVGGELTSSRNVNAYTTDGGATPGGWHEISYPGLDGDINCLEFINDSLGYATSTEGELFRTTDAGITWEDASSTISGTINNIKFINDDFGYLLGEDFNANAGAFKISSNQGYTWTYKSFGSRAFLQDASFYNDQIGWAVSFNGYVFKTVNGGELWQHKGRPTSEDLMAVFFLDENNGWASGDKRRVLITHDGAESWTYYPGVDIPATVITDIHFLDENNGWMCGKENVIVRTDDGGITWTDLSPANLSRDYWDIHFSDASNGYVCGSNGLFAVTSDGGDSWTELETGTIKTLMAMDFVGSSSIWIAGSMTIIHSPDGGQTWENFEDFLLMNYMGTTYKDIIAINDNSVYAVGEFGYRTHTVDGGSTWYRQNSPAIEEDLQAVVRANEKIFAVGENGAVLELHQ